MTSDRALIVGLGIAQPGVTVVESPDDVAALVDDLDVIVVEASGRRRRGDVRGLPHRLVLVGDDGGVRFHDDSKATDPHAVVAFEGSVPVTLAESMDAALVSPGRASFDWYRNHGERGDDLARAVREALA